MLRYPIALRWLAPIAVFGVAAVNVFDPNPTPVAVANVESIASPIDDTPPLVGVPTIADVPAPERACDDGLEAARASIARDDDAVPSEELLDLCTTTRAAMRVAGCAPRLHAMLRSSRACGHAFQTTLTCAVPDPSFDASLTRDLLEHAAGRCAGVVARSLHQASSVDLDLARLVASRGLAEPNQARRATYDLALGSIGHAARTTSIAPAVAAFVDREVARALTSARGGRRRALLEAAGNAGCVACVAEARASLHDSDDDIRRAAIRSFRFVTTTNALTAMCDALGHDAITDVRADAAWSLQWSASDEFDRAACLERAAMNDADERVRGAAAQSLLALAERSPSAASALARMQGDEPARALPGEIVALPAAPSSFDPLALR